MEIDQTLKSRPDVGTGGFLEPEVVIRELGLKSGDHAADFGAGHGYFTIPMARIVGGDGRIYAVDIQKSVLEVIRSKARLEHLLNIETVWSDLDNSGGSRLKDNFMDLVLVANILFQADDRGVLFKEASRVLRQGGRLAVVEWSPGANLSFGPAEHLRISKEEVKKFAADAGFSLQREFGAGAYHYGILFRKS